MNSNENKEIILPSGKKITRKVFSEYSEEEFCEIIKESYSISHLMILADIHRSYYSKIKNLIEEKKIDISHFKRVNNVPIEKKLCEKSGINSKSLKSYLQKNNILEEKCAICGILPIWNNKQLNLQLDHINGNHYDNRVENLRLICPNCHSQTDTFTGRNTRKHPIKNCKTCNKELRTNNTSLVCISCIEKEKHLCTVCKVNPRPGNWSKCNDCRKKESGEKKLCSVCEKPLRKGTNVLGYHKKCFNA